MSHPPVSEQLLFLLVLLGGLQLRRGLAFPVKRPSARLLYTLTIGLYDSARRGLIWSQETPDGKGVERGYEDMADSRGKDG